MINDLNHKLVKTNSNCKPLKIIEKYKNINTINIYKYFKLIKQKKINNNSILLHLIIKHKYFSKINLLYIYILIIYILIY